MKVFIIFIVVFSIFVNAEIKQLTIDRVYHERCTLGYIKELDIFTLEPPHYKYSGNSYFSCIEEGTYKVRFERMKTYGMKEVRLLLLDSITGLPDKIKKTAGRYTNGIFFHEGNTVNYTIGCILVAPRGAVQEDNENSRYMFKNMEVTLEGLHKLEAFFLKEGQSKESQQTKAIEGYVRIQQDSAKGWVKKIDWLFEE